MSNIEVFDPVAAGEYLGGSRPIAPETLAIYRIKGVGPRFFRVGRYIRYRREDLDAYIADGLRSSTSEAA